MLTSKFANKYLFWYTTLWQNGEIVIQLIPLKNFRLSKTDCDANYIELMVLARRLWSIWLLTINWEPISIQMARSKINMLLISEISKTVSLTIHSWILYGIQQFFLTKKVSLIQVNANRRTAVHWSAAKSGAWSAISIWSSITWLIRRNLNFVWGLYTTVSGDLYSLWILSIMNDD